MRKLVIDGDSIPFLCSKDTLDESIQNVDNLISDILGIVGSSQYLIVFGKGPYFRHAIDENYKGNRKESNLKYLKTLRSYILETYNSRVFYGIEADDVVGILSQEEGAIIAAMDKDILQQIPGTHFNYRTREWVETSEEDAYRFLYTQVLAGDSTDNITGIPGIGPKKATIILNEYQGDDVEASFYAYTQKYGEYKGVEQFYTQFKLVYILRRYSEVPVELGVLDFSIPEIDEF